MNTLYEDAELKTKLAEAMAAHEKPAPVKEPTEAPPVKEPSQHQAL